MTVGERIRSVRESKGMTQSDLAKIMGYSGKTSIHRAETSGNQLNLKTVSKFAKALGVTESYLMGWHTDEEIDKTAVLVANISKDEEWLKCSELYYSYSDEKQKLIRNTIINLKDC